MNLPLKLNDNNEDIKKLHSMLQMLHYPVRNVTNHFDSNTQNLVISFQNDFRLKVTGIVDNDTWNALENATGKAEKVEEIIEQRVEDVQETNKTAEEVESMIEPESIEEITEDVEEIDKITEESIEDKMEVILPENNRIEKEEIVSESTQSYPILKIESFGPDVVELQLKLMTLGYLTGNTNGIFDVFTEQAVKDFQRDQRLVIDGIVGYKTWTALENIMTPKYTEYYILKEGSIGEAVAILQDKLKTLGYFSENISGSFGPKTTESVRAFQSNNGLVPDGIVGNQTSFAIDSIYQLFTNYN